MGRNIETLEPDLAYGFGGAQLIHRLDGGGCAGGSDPGKDDGAYRFQGHQRRVLKAMT